MNDGAIHFLMISGDEFPRRREHRTCVGAPDGHRRCMGQPAAYPPHYFRKKSLLRSVIF